MDTPESSLRELARRLLALERARPSAADPRAHEGVRVCEKLRTSLSRFAGPDGFASLMRRAIVLARAEAPLLDTVRLNPDDCMKDLEHLAADAREAGTDAAVAIIAYLLGLLVTFIGESLTMHLVREAWPEISLNE